MDITSPADFFVSGDLHANIVTVIQDIHIPAELPPKNVRFNVEKPIVTFTGREQFLNDLHRTIQESRGQIGQVITVLTQAPLPIIAATGGVGKTETVRMYIHQHGHKYDHVIWIDAEDSFLAKGQFQNLAMKLKIPREFDNKAKPFELILKEVYEALCQNAHSVLLVFDNAESFDNFGGSIANNRGIREFLPGCLSPFFVEPTILVTSRNQNWRFQNIIQLDLWTPMECVKFVLTLLKLQLTKENKSIALELGELFGRLPIAMQSAVSVILQECEENASNHVTDAVKLLISDYKAGIKEVLATQPLNSSACITMISLWNISLKKIVLKTHGELAIKILSTMAYLSPTSVPKVFLRSLFESPAVNKSSFAQALILLTNYSLITMYKKHFSMHRMIQDVTIQNLKTKIGASAELIFSQNTFSDESTVLMRLSGQLYKHSMTLSAEKDRVLLRGSDILANYIHVSQRHLADKLATNYSYMRFSLVVADILREASDNERAIDMFTAVLEVVKTGDSKLTLGIQTNMALALLAHGQYEKAEKVYTEIYNVKATTFGPGHLETLRTKSEIASMLHYQDKYESSKQMLSEVLDGFQSLNMSSTPEAIRNKHNLAGLHAKLGKYQQGLKLFREVLHEIEAAPHIFKNPDKEIIIAKSNIASVLQIKGHTEEAENILAELTATAETILGEYHPLTSHVKGNYANTLSTWEISDGGDKQGKSLDAFENLRQIQERLLGPEHPKTMYTKTRVADELFKQGKTAAASKLSKNLFEISRSSNCFSNPHIVENVKIHEATVLVREAKYNEGIRLYIEVLNELGKVAGPKHPQIGNTQLLLAWAYIRKGEYENALRVCQYVLVLEKLLRGSHSKTFMDAAKYFLSSLTEYIKIMYFGLQLDPSCPEDLVTLLTKIALVDKNQGERYLHVSKLNIIFALRRYFEVNVAESRKAICSVLENEYSTGNNSKSSGSSVLEQYSHVVPDISGDIEIMINDFIEKLNDDDVKGVMPLSGSGEAMAHNNKAPEDSFTLLNIIAYIPLADYCQLSLKLLEDILASSFNKALLPTKLQLIEEASLVFVFKDPGTPVPDSVKFVEMHCHVQQCLRKRLDAEGDFSYLLGVCKYFSQLGVDSMLDIEETILFLHEYLRERTWPHDSISYSIIFCSVLIRVYEKLDAAFTVAQDVLEFIRMHKNSGRNSTTFVGNDLNLFLLCIFTLSRSNQMTSKCFIFQSWTESVLKQTCETALVSLLVRPSPSTEGENAKLYCSAHHVELIQKHTYLFCLEKLKFFHSVANIKDMDEEVVERVVSKILLILNTPTFHDAQSLDPMHGLLWRCFYKLYLWL